MVKAKLECLDRHKSFWGKAFIIYEPRCVYLESYGTIVGKINPDNGMFVRLWNGYSDTTLRHVQSFCKFFHALYGGKAWWHYLPVGGVPESCASAITLSDFDKFIEGVGECNATSVIE